MYIINCIGFVQVWLMIIAKWCIYFELIRYEEYLGDVVWFYSLVWFYSVKFSWGYSLATF